MNRLGNCYTDLPPSLTARRKALDQIGDDRSKNDFRLHAQRGTAVVGGHPHTNISLIHEQPMERHDNEQPRRLPVSPRASNGLQILDTDLDRPILLS